MFLVAAAIVVIGGFFVASLPAKAVTVNTVESSTLVFESVEGYTLTDNGDGSYSGVVPCKTGYDVYAKNSATAYLDDTPVIISNNDAWPTWDPNTPDWYQYSLYFYEDGGIQKWAIRNHAGATEENPWYNDEISYPARGVPLSGTIDWANSYAKETETGAYLPGTGTAKYEGKAVSYGGGTGYWDMDWSWGSEAVPLAFPGFTVNVSGGDGAYTVTMTPADGRSFGVSSPGPVVNDNTGESYETIQSAINAASANDTINVSEGTYNEDIAIGIEGVVVNGESAETTIINGTGAGTVIAITANNVTLSGFTVTGSGGDPAADAGIMLNTVTDCTITDNEISIDVNGIAVIAGARNIITTNTIFSDYYGVLLVGTTDNTVELNTISNQGLDAIALDNLSVVGGSVETGSTGNYIKTNTISNVGRDGIFIGENCNGNFITDANNLSDITSIGINLWRPGTQTITDNVITNTTVGIRLLGSSENTITNNTITGGTEAGIKADRSWQVGVWYPSDNNFIANNNLSGNALGISALDNNDVLIDATENYWGTADKSVIQANVTAGVDFEPYYVDAGMTILNTDSAADNILYVDDDFAEGNADGHTYGYDAFSKIQDAIDNASTTAVTTISVAAGTYNESVLIEKSLNLTGSADSKPIVSGNAGVNYIGKINAISGVKISNLEFNGGGSAVGDNGFDYGILVINSGTSDNPIEIKNSTIKNIWKSSGNGIGIEESSYVLAHDNVISSFHKRGIRFINSEGEFYNNEVIGDNVDGTNRVQNLVNLWGGSSVEIYKNKLHNALTTPGVTPTWDSPGIFVTSYGGRGASTANIYENEIYNCDSGIIVGSVYADTDTSSATITNNNLHNLTWAINFEKNSVTATITKNVFSNNTENVNAEINSGLITDPPAVDATKNWWGTAEKTDIESKIYEGVLFEPYYTNAAMTTLSDGETTDASYTSKTEGEVDMPSGATNIVLSDTTVLDLSAGLDGNEVVLNSGVSSQSIVLTNSNLNNVSVNIQDETKVQGPAGWDGKITPPKEDSGTIGNAPSGFSVGNFKIEVGSSAGTLYFDKPVKIILTGVTGTVGYRPSGSSDWKTITTVCAGADDYTGISPLGECYHQTGGNTVIWTYHFTTFGNLTTSSSGSSSGGGGGGGGSYSSSQTTTSTPTPTPTPTSTDESSGQVLGVQAFADGAIIRAKGDIDVYIVKYVGSKQFKRLILSPSVFNSYQHLRWEDIVEVEQSVLDSFTTSDLVRAAGDTQVYKLTPAGDTGAKQWIRTENAFRNRNYDWDAIYEINSVDRNSYTTGTELE
ncbi:MAG: right-handed parallel beta-helix repeat-containing protein [Candidatus Portnoybacteria bacterium]|nr:right-handed parallel beta-helix repeat-containing protein [Candidatus Portnoybacteria bacterium]